MDIRLYIENAKDLLRYRGLDVEENLGAAYEGLHQAAQNFKPEYGVKFWTFASRRVLGAVSDYRRTLGVGSRASRRRGLVPVHVPIHENIQESSRNDKHTFQYLVHGLDRTDKLILTLYYLEDLTMNEIGQTIGLSESRISQRHKILLAMLKEKFRETYRQHL